MDALHEKVHALLRFAEHFLHAGSTAYRTREALRRLAHPLGLDSLSMKMDMRAIVATARQGHERVTLVRELNTPGVDGHKLHCLQHFIDHAPHTLDAPTLERFIDDVTAAPRLHGPVVTSLTVGLACAAFAFLNGGSLTEMFAAAIAASFGQYLRDRLHQRHLSPYAIYSLCGLGASALYLLCAKILLLLGLDSEARHAAGFISSVLFLVPGFPMISGVLDLLSQETTIAQGRLVHVLMLLLMAALGLATVIAVSGLTLDPATPPHLPLPDLLAGRIAASFIGAFGFAVLFNATWRDACYVGVLAVLGNGLRLALRDAGMSLPMATFLGAMLVGALTTLLLRRLDEPRITLTVPGIIMMVPGVYTFETLVRFNEGVILEALRSGVLASFVIGAMSMGLAFSRFMSERLVRLLRPAAPTVSNII